MNKFSPRECTLSVLNRLNILFTVLYIWDRGVSQMIQMIVFGTGRYPKCFSFVCSNLPSFGILFYTIRKKNPNDFFLSQSLVAGWERELKREEGANFPKKEKKGNRVK